MCDEPMPCACTIEKREKLRSEHIWRHNQLQGLAFRLWQEGHIVDGDLDLLYEQANKEWDDAIHIASPDDPLRSLCGCYGRNLCDLPKRPDGASGCWTCLQRADELAAARVELVKA